MEIVATAVAVGDKVVVVGEEEAVARLRRELERGTFMLSRNDHKQHHDTPVFYCLRRWFRNFSAWDGEDIIWPLRVGRYQICQYPGPFACMRRNRCCCGRGFESRSVFDR